MTITRTPIAQQRNVAAHVGATLLAFVAAGCLEGRPDAAPVSKRSLALEGQSVMVPIYRADPPVSDFVDRAQRLLEVVVGRSVSGLPQESASLPDGTLVWKDVEDAPGIVVTYQQASDDLVVRNVALESDYDGLLRVPPLSKDSARSIFENALSRLEAVGLIDTSELDLTDVSVGTTEHLQGVSGETPPAPDILDYRFRVKRKLGQMQLRNSIVRVGVTRSAEIGSIRIMRGAVRLEVVDQLARKVDDGECFDRFRAEFPSAVIKQQGVGYFVPTDAAGQSTVEPQCYFTFLQEFVITGVPTVTRTKDVRYSVLDADADPVVFGGSPMPPDEEAK